MKYIIGALVGLGLVFGGFVYLLGWIDRKAWQMY